MLPQRPGEGLSPSPVFKNNTRKEYNMKTLAIAAIILVGLYLAASLTIAGKALSAHTSVEKQIAEIEKTIK